MRPLALPRLAGGLQAQLTLGTLGLVVALLVGVGVFQYLAFRSFLLQQLSASLHAQAHYAIAGRGRPALAIADPVVLAREASSPSVRAGVVGPGGELFALGPAGPAGLTWSTPGASALMTAGQRGARPDYRLVEAGGRTVIMVAEPLARDASSTLVLEGSLQPTDALLQGDLLIYAAGSAAAVLLGALLSVLLSRRALRRLHQVSLAAAGVAAGDLGRRAAIGGTDEVAALGGAFDEMVERLQDEMNRRQSSEMAMRRFLADASHELRTPIALIRGNLDIIKRGATADLADLALSVEDMRRAAIRMSRLVEDLLTLARIEQGERPKVGQVSVRRALEDAARAGRQISPRRQFRVEAPPGLEVAADAEAVHRVLINLIDNALKYTPEETPIVLAARETAAGTVQIEVIDRGPGIPDAEQRRIFDRFYRGRTRSAGGSGLGLAISRGLMAGQGGTLEVRSAVGRGAAFVLELPASPNSPLSRAGRSPRARAG